jgi:dTDP-4-dehydrorhamnose reductase
MTTLIVLGANGQVGRNVVRLAGAQGRNVTAYSRAELDITDAAALAEAITPDSFVLNCAAYTAVDQAETERDLAWAINGTAPGEIAKVCAAKNAALLHISTDYVFGQPLGRLWRELDPLAPQNEYGRGKVAGELAVAAALPRHLILRTSWVFDDEGKNFVRTMLRLGGERPELRIVGDQQGGPTAAADIAAAMLAMVDQANDPSFSGWGTYHYSGAPATTWYEFAEAIFAGRQTPKLVKITTAEFPTPAQRPLYSVLDCRKIRQVFGIEQPDWRVALNEMLQRLTPAK